MNPRVVAVIASRIASSRLPGKAFADVDGHRLIWQVLRRVAQMRLVDRLVLAVPSHEQELYHRELAQEVYHNFASGQPLVPFTMSDGDEDDVLGRVARAARKEEADWIVRITGDCPLIDPAVSDAVVAYTLACGASYGANIQPFADWADGLDTEVIRADVLATASMKATTAFDREHVTPWVRDYLAAKDKAYLRSPTDMRAVKWSVDTWEDLDRVRQLYAEFGPECGWRDIMAW